MTPYALGVCSIAAVLGTLAVSREISDDLRPVAAVAITAMTLFALHRSAGKPPTFRALLLVALVGSALNAWMHQHVQASVQERPTARYSGILLGRQPLDNAVEAALDLDGGLRVLATFEGAIPPIGSHVVVRGRLTPFDGPRNPGEASERALQRERGFDARLDAARILSAAPLSPLDSRAWLPRAHEWAHDELRLRLGEPAASLVAGELWGERAALPPDLRAEFQETGTVHVLVTAGLHLGAVAALVAVLLGALALPRSLSCAIAIACVWAFATWSGAQLPAERAATMITAALAARAFGRATFSWNSLALAALAIALMRPESVATASFALSFSCVGAIFAVARPLESWFERAIELPQRLREAVVLSLATQLGTWPLSAAIFLQFSPYAVLANLAVVPCVALTMALGAAQLALAWAPPLAQACANVNSWPIAWTLGVVRTFASLPASAIAMTPAPSWCIALYDGALLATPWLLRRGGLAVALAALASATSFVLWPPLPHDGLLRITVLDVGQADAIVVQTPQGHAMLVDAGGRLERGPQGNDSSAERVGERIVVPFLLRHGIHALDALIISHPHGEP